MKKRILIILTIAVILAVGWWVIEMGQFASGVINDSKNFNIRDSVLRDKQFIIPSTEKGIVETNSDSETILFKDTNFNLDSLSRLWIQGDLGLDKEDLKEITIKTREKFSKINSTKNWDRIEEIDIWETLEGGIATYYFKGDELKKIHVRNFGETFQNVQEFYLDTNGIFFVFEMEYRYNRPFDYYSVSMIENKDNQFFDFDESTITEVRSYFHTGKLIRQISNQDCGSPNSIDYRLEENIRINQYYNSLIQTQLKTDSLSPKQGLYLLPFTRN